LHPLVVQAAGELYLDGHFASAIFEAFKAVELQVQDVSALYQSGRDLMTQAFGGAMPRLVLSDLPGRSGTNEQEGWKLIFMGAMVGVRNPKAHEQIDQNDPQRTFEYLAFASLLMRRIDDSVRLASRTKLPGSS
jgi:uncharacterized protein (TIGR02391 family)